jgi:hypothetical protein
MKFFILGCVITVLFWSAILMTCSILAWQAKGSIEWGIVLFLSGLTTRAMLDKL